MQSEAREIFMQAATQKAAFDAHDARTERKEKLAAELVMEYLVNVCTLYAIPACELMDRVRVKVLQDFGNG